jgi:lipopolysaccharide/colanic/teichoic acid biosynthesis glycosyltransferase
VNALLLDRPLPVECDGTGHSVLTLPFGAGILLERLLERMPGPPRRSLLVMAEGASPRMYQARLGNRPVRRRVKVIGRRHLSRAVEFLEMNPDEPVLVYDAMKWPLKGGFSLASLDGPHRTHRVAHLVLLPTRYDGVQERLDCDGNGEVRRIRRVFGPDGTEAQAQVVASRVPVGSCREVEFATLPELRTNLVLRGVLSTDTPLEGACLELSTPEGLLALHAHVLEHGAVPARRDSGPRLNGHARLETHRAARSAKLIGAVFIQDQATVEEDALLIGPVTVGAGARIGRGATVAQSIVCAGAVVPSGVTVHGELVAGPRDCSSTPHPKPAAHAVRATAPNRFASEDVPRKRAAYLAIKRAFDLTLALVGTILVSPILVAAALWVKWDSAGPVFFTHLREGRGGREFRCIKFRTMIVGADQQQRSLLRKNRVDGPQFKLDDDPRVTGVGRLLRATNIDELPQLFNVIAGHMSLVGPRPSPFRENQICVAWRRGRLSVRPGITGLWQMCRQDRSSGDFHQWIHYDLAYVRNQSFWLDLTILLATVLTLGGRKQLPLSWFVRTAGRRSAEGDESAARPLPSAA